MKKLLALVLCIVFVCTLSVVAFADESPKSDQKFNVVVRQGTTVNGTPATGAPVVINDGDTVTIKPDGSQSGFSGWDIKKRNPDGSMDEAVEGVDYELVEGTTTGSEQIKIRPKTDLQFEPSYNGLHTDPTDAAGATGTKYKIIKGANATWKQGSGKDLLIASDAPFEKFASVEVDGKTIAASNYTAVSGSTEVTLKASYLETLALGAHSFQITSNDGSAHTKFTVVDKNGNSTSPKTGVNYILYVVMILTAAAVCFGAVKVYSK